MNSRLLLSPVFALALLLSSLATASATAGAAPAEQTTLPVGAIVGLRGTPHLWIADESGVLHWSGDTRALAGRSIDWGNRRDVSLDELRALSRGAPWLSAGLLKDGDPIYFVKWEDSQPAPQLLHVQSIADVELFGINATNYGQFVLDRAAWEARFSFSVATLARGVLAGAAPATPSTSTTTTATTSTTAQRGILANAISPEEQTAFLESALSLGRRGMVIKWTEPVKVQLRRTSYSTEPPIVDSMVAEANTLLNGLPVSRVTSSANIVIDFVPLTEIIAVGGPDALGYATHRSRDNGSLAECVISVAHDPENVFGSNARHVSPQMKTDLLGLVIRHEFGHCLGLGHNNSDKSFMSYSYDPWESYYTRGARTASFADFDKALIRTLYHSAVRAGMRDTDLGNLFAAS